MKIAFFALFLGLVGCVQKPSNEILDRLNELNSRIDDLQTENKAMTEVIGRLSIDVTNNCRAR